MVIHSGGIEKMAKTATRKGRMLAKDGSLELWVIPAEANGWRAVIHKRGKGNYVPMIKTEWRSTRTAAGAVARGWKSRYFGGK